MANKNEIQGNDWACMLTSRFGRFYRLEISLGLYLWSFYGFVVDKTEYDQT